MKRLKIVLPVLLAIASLTFVCFNYPSGDETNIEKLKADFRNPPDAARPGVYWYFMDGNLSREEMTKDLESMKEVGISNLIFLEVGIGVPRGPVDFMSEEWQDLYVHAVREAERLGIKIVMGAGFIVKPKLKAIEKWILNLQFRNREVPYGIN